MIRTDGWTQEPRDAGRWMKRPPPETLHLLSAVAVWLVTGTTISSLNKWIFAVYNFRYPLLLSALHMLTAIVVDYGLIKYYFVRSKWVRGQDLTSSAKCKVFLLSLTFCASIAFGNLGLNYVQLSFAQMIYTTTPIFTLAISSLVLGQQHHVLKYTAMMPICIGASFSIMGEVQFDQTGCLFVVAATMLRGVKSIQQSILLQEEKINSVRLLYLMAIPSFLILAVAALALENWAGLQWPPHYDGRLWGFIVLSCLGSVLYNLASCCVISRTSAVTLHILGNLNVVGNLLLSQLLFGSTFSSLSCAGAALTLFGMLVYQNSELIATYLDGRRAGGVRAAEETDPGSPSTLDPGSEREPYSELSSDMCHSEEPSVELYDDPEPWSDLEPSYHSTERPSESPEEEDLQSPSEQPPELNDEPWSELFDDLEPSYQSIERPSELPLSDLESSSEVSQNLQAPLEPPEEQYKNLEPVSKQSPGLKEDPDRSLKLNDHLESPPGQSRELDADLKPHPELDFDPELCDYPEPSPDSIETPFRQPPERNDDLRTSSEQFDDPEPSLELCDDLETPSELYNSTEPPLEPHGELYRDLKSPSKPPEQKYDLESSQELHPELDYDPGMSCSETSPNLCHGLEPSLELYTVLEHCPETPPSPDLESSSEPANGPEPTLFLDLADDPNHGVNIFTSASMEPRPEAPPAREPPSDPEQNSDLEHPPAQSSKPDPYTELSESSRTNSGEPASSSEPIHEAEFWTSDPNDGGGTSSELYHNLEPSSDVLQTTSGLCHNPQTPSEAPEELYKDLRPPSEQPPALKAHLESPQEPSGELNVDPASLPTEPLPHS